MKKLILFIPVLAISCMAVSCCNKTECKNDECANQEIAPELPVDIAQVIEYYADGGRQGDASVTAKAFADGATMSWNQNDTLHCEPIQTLYDYVTSTGPEDVSYTVENFSVAGSVATVYIASTFGETSYDDMFTLVKGQNGWKIVSKVYSVK